MKTDPVESQKFSVVDFVIIPQFQWHACKLAIS